MFGGSIGVTAHQPNGVVLKMDEVQPVRPYRAEHLIKRQAGAILRYHGLNE